jgi:hypothetical protein
MNHWWSVPFSEAILHRIKEDCLNNNLRFIYEEEENQAAGVRRISRSDIPNYRSCPQEFSAKLRELLLMLLKNSSITFSNLRLTALTK